MNKLHVSDELTLPLDAVTQTFLVVGKRGSGKSNTAARFVEQLHRAHLPFVVLDPVDTWWGLKASADGGRGLDVYVFGGAHADLPLESHGGALLAETLCEHRIPMVLSVKHLSGRERSAFMVAFAQTLFQKWSGGPLHVVLEEAHELAPQMAGSRGSQSNTDNEAAMLGAFKRLWKLGRASGIGGSAITQRPASLSKDITTQSEILIAHRTIGPQDVAAIGEWVKYHGERADLLAELPSLPTGQAFVWSPEFPEGQPIGLQRTTILRRETFDSASTPKVGEKRVEPKELAPVDLDRLREKMAKTIERAKADDPKELKKQLADAKREIDKLRHSSIQPAKVETKTKIVEKFVLKDGQITRLAKLVAQLGDVENRAFDITAAIQEERKEIVAAIERTKQRETEPARPSGGYLFPGDTPKKTIREFKSILKKHEAGNPPPAAHSGALSKKQQQILDALAWLESIGNTFPTNAQLGAVALIDTSGGYFSNVAGPLSAGGLIERGDGRTRLTDAGRAVARLPEEPPTVDKYHDVLRSRVAKMKSAARRTIDILDYIISRGGESVTAEEIGKGVGIDHTGGYFSNMIGPLSTLGAITRRGGIVEPTPILFPERLS